MVLASLLAVLGLALVHMFAGKLRFLEGIPRSHWLSIAGGVSVAYVFIHLLPELSESQEAIARLAGEALAFLEHHVYLVALVGLVAFYGLERAALESRERNSQAGEAGATSPGVFWIHIASFAAYNALVGYLMLYQAAETASGLLFFFVAMALHFVVNDYGLREHHKDAYTRIGRWVLAVAVFVGWGLSFAAEVSEAIIAVLIAFLAGGIVLNVFKEELPAERESRFWSFALGTGCYAAILLAL